MTLLTLLILIKWSWLAHLDLWTLWGQKAFCPVLIIDTNYVRIFMSQSRKILSADVNKWNLRVLNFLLLLNYVSVLVRLGHDSRCREIINWVSGIAPGLLRWKHYSCYVMLTTFKYLLSILRVYSLLIICQDSCCHGRFSIHFSQY